MLYIDKELSHIKDTDVKAEGDKPDGTGYDGKNGVRCVRISPDGKHLASGDREGNIRYHVFSSYFYLFFLIARRRARVSSGSLITSVDERLKNHCHCTFTANLLPLASSALDRIGC